MGCAIIALMSVGGNLPGQSVVDIEVLQNGTPDLVARRELSTGHQFAFTLHNFGTLGGPDARITFTCSGGSQVIITSCPTAAVFLPPAALQDPAGDTTVYVTAAIGTATTNMRVQITAIGRVVVNEVVYADTAVGWWDLQNLVPVQATISPTGATPTMARGASDSSPFTLTNTGLLPTSYDFVDVAGCGGGLVSCTRTPSTVGPINAGTAGQVTYSWSASSAGVFNLPVVASVASPNVAWPAKQVVAGSITVTVVDAVATASPSTIAIPVGTTGFNYGGFSVALPSGAPAATLSLLVSGSANLNPRFAATQSPTTSLSLSSGTPSSSAPVLLDMPDGTGGAVTLQVSYLGSVLSTTTLSVIGGALTPTAASTTALVGSTNNTFLGLSLSGTPNTDFSVSLNGTCSFVTNCVFSNGLTSITVPSTSGTVTVPVRFDAPTVTTTPGTIPVKLTYGGVQLATAVVDVTVTTDLAITSPNALVAPGVPGQTQVFQVQNSGGARAGVTFTDNCATLPAPAAVTSCSVSPAGPVTLLASSTTPVTVTFTGGAALASSILTLTASAGTPLASGTTALGVASATVAAPAAMNVTQSAVTQTASFVLTNLGPSAVTYVRTVSCTPNLAPCAYAGANTILNVGQGTTAAATYTPSSVGAGMLRLQARLNSITGPIVAADSVSITVQAGQVGVIVATANLTADSLLYRDQCVSLSLGSDVASECGDLRVIHPLPTVRTMGTWRTPTLSYASGHARAYPIVPVNLTLPTGSSIPTSVSAALKVNNVTYATSSWTGSEWVAGATRRVVVGFDATAAGLATGVYPYVLEVTTTFAGSSTITTGSGQLVVVDRSTSAFGAGWWVSGVESLNVSNASRLVWVGGDGGVRIYNQRAGSVAPNRVWGAASLTYPDSIREQGSEFVRKLPDSVHVFFNAQGRHVRTRNRQGHETVFAYDGSGRLSTISLPPSTSPAVYTFSYNANGKLATVTAPGNTALRTVTVAVDAATGRLSSITDPGAPTRTINFGYGASTHRITSRTNGRAITTNFTYDTASRVATSVLPMPGAAITRSITNWQVYGRITSVDTGSVEVALVGPRPTQTTRFKLNKYAAPNLIIDALGQFTTLTRAAAGLPGLVTTTTNPANQTVTAVYDPRGRITSSTQVAPSGSLATTTYTWDPVWDQIARITNPAGDFTQFGVDPANGNRIWQEDARGPMSRTTFSYYADNLLNTISPPVSGSEQYTYDAKGNANQLFGTLDRKWSWTNNSNTGLTTSESVPTGNGVLGAPFEVTTTSWNGRTQPLISTTTVSGGTRVVTRTYDEEDNLKSITRAWTPNTQGLAAQVTTYTYDNADRATHAAETVGGTQVTGYDEAGNVTSIALRSGGSVGMTYDGLNRMRTRTVSGSGAFGYPAPNIVPATGIETAPYNYSVTGETQTFTWDPTNQIATATGRDGDVLRSYHPSGALMSETQVIRYRNRTGSHTYSLAYTYDVNGRRRTLTLSPSSLFSGSPMSWGYNSWGALDAVTDIAGNSWSFGYNAKGELTSTTYPGGVTQTRTYDDGGYLATDVITGPTPTPSFPFYPNQTIRNFSVTLRNARGQIRSSNDAAGFAGDGPPRAGYNPFGNVTADTVVAGGYTLNGGTNATFTSTNAYTYDGLGNMLSSSGGYGLSTALPVSFSTVNTYTAATGRLFRQVTTSGGTSRRTDFSYDGGGNTRFENTTPPGGGYGVEERASYYRGDDKVVAVDRRISGRRTLDEYRYDALGRRIWVSTGTSCAPTNAVECVTSSVRRTIWDGEQILAEIRAPYDTILHTEELDTGFPTYPVATALEDPNVYYGRVVYGPGVALDQPLSVTRYEYKDNPPNDPLTWPRFSVSVLWDYRGTPVFGLFTDGAQYKPYQPTQGQSSCPAVGLAARSRCVQLQWPFAGTAYDKTRGLITTGWHGSLLAVQRDGAGLEYMRNRMYDPKTGRFTQEDPIGLAGGLNLYGYAGGDPVNFSDPFGLRPDTLERTRETAPVIDSCARLSETCRREVDLIERSPEKWKVQFGDQSDCDADARGGCMRVNPMGTGGTIFLTPGSYSRAAQLRGLPVNDFTVFGHEAGHVLTRRLMFCRTSEVCALQHEDAVRRDLGMPRRRP